MILYNVTMTIQAEFLEDFFKWMKMSQIPKIMSTGLFLDCTLSTRLIPQKNGYQQVIARFLCRNMNDYTDYLKNFSKKMQADIPEKFGKNYKASRTIDVIDYQYNNT